MGLLEEPEEKQTEEKSPDYSGVIIFLALLPLLLFFDHIGKADVGLNLTVCVGVNLIAIRLRWKLRKHLWFWGAMAMLLAIEVPVVLKIQWPRGWVPGIALVPIGLVGIFIAFGVVGFVERFIMKTSPSDEEQ